MFTAVDQPFSMFRRRITVDVRVGEVHHGVTMSMGEAVPLADQEALSILMCAAAKEALGVYMKAVKNVESDGSASSDDGETLSDESTSSDHSAAEDSDSDYEPPLDEAAEEAAKKYLKCKNVVGRRFTWDDYNALKKRRHH